jgi:sulfatase modifying factor 1
MRFSFHTSLDYLLLIAAFSCSIIAGAAEEKQRQESGDRLLSEQALKTQSRVIAQVQPIRPKPAPAGAANVSSTPSSAEGLPIPEMVLVPEGDFIMGSVAGKNDEVPVHRVYLHTYYIGKYEVTNREFAAFVKEKNYVTWAERTGKGLVPIRGEWKNIRGSDWRHPRGPGTSIDGLDNHPVVQVSWQDAMDYCKWLTQKTGLRYRLPTEAEWEKASRAADGRTWPWGITYPEIWANVAGDYDGYDFTAPVGSFPQGRSPYGCYDMAGNVWEWCMDWYLASYYEKSPAVDPVGPTSGMGRVIRGGSFYYFTGYLAGRCSNRGLFSSEAADCNLGFRVVRVP